ncbi:MAG: hypothetical protein M1389_12055 [Chloroflexi bacterium]|nr:hypothetical protein [Chloroflexota bacterium]
MRQSIHYLLPLFVVSLPTILLARHSKIIFPYYLLTVPMHFLFISLGLWHSFKWLRQGMVGRSKVADHSQKVSYATEFRFHNPIQWRRGEQITWWRTDPAPTDLDPGVYHYLLGLYTITETSYRNATCCGPKLDVNLYWPGQNGT